MLLDGPDDPAMLSGLDNFGEKTFAHLAANPSRLADEIPFCRRLRYKDIESVAPELAINIVKRFTYLVSLAVLNVDRPVEDIARFREFLSCFDNIAELKFWCDQPQDLFDLLPDCAVQKLKIRNEHSGLCLGFLLRLKSLIDFKLSHSIDAESVRKAFEELEFLSIFGFSYAGKEIRIRKHCPKLFKVSIDARSADVPDLNAALRFIAQNTQWRE